MRRRLCSGGLVVLMLLGLARIGWTQEVVRLTIHNVTSELLATGEVVLVITGVGFGEAPAVTVDGQSVPVLAGASATRLTVLTPPIVLTTPGTYRLTVADPARQLGDAFVVASLPGSVGAAGAGGTAGTAAAAGTSGGTVVLGGGAGAGIGADLIEDIGAPFRTAIGYQALVANTSGVFNTASGYQALRNNTTGNYNTASGTYALYSNTTGSYNTASGYQALVDNTTGISNTASGSWALGYNTTGSYNTASGFYALQDNTTGVYNTATGYQTLGTNTTGIHNTASGSWALGYNTTGNFNTASGFNALRLNSTGTYNTSSGAYALSANTAGIDNTASGAYALTANTTGGYNTASGSSVLYFNTTGFANTASGYAALSTNTTGTNNTASGTYALYASTTGRNNTALGSYAGYLATSGHYNLFLGAQVYGTASDTNTIRIGEAYDGAMSPAGGQNRTFIAGIRGTPLAGGAAPVVIDANGQLGVSTSGVLAAGAGYGCVGCGEAGKIEIYNPSTGDMTIQSAPHYRMLLNPAGGNIGVGVNSMVGSGALFGCPYCAQSGFIKFYDQATGHLTIQSGPWFATLLNPAGGNVGIGLSAPAYPLHLGSGAYVSAGGVWTNASSRTVKQDIADLTLDGARAVVAQLAPVTYAYTANPGERHVGFIAEDVPDLVATSDRKGLSPMDIVAVITKVVQDQQATITTLQRANADLQRANADLQARLARLEALVASVTSGGVK